MAEYAVRQIPDEQYKKLRDLAADETKAEGKNDSINKQILEAIKQYLAIN
jgi:hypothetical protein